jgi:hypothetical protein
MTLMILYHNPVRPDEAGMTMIAGRPKAAAIIALLEKRGLVVDKVTYAPLRPGFEGS